MKRKFSLLLPIFFLSLCVLPAQNELFQQSELQCALSHPWEIAYGPDGYLWVTEARAYRVSRIDPHNGEMQLVADLSAQRLFPQNQDPWPQGGLMGLALHPGLLEDKPYVYLAYVYRFDSCAAENAGCFFQTKVVRYVYNATTHTFGSEIVICDTIPGSTDHNGGRLAIGMVEGSPYLFYSVGDMGSGQFLNAERPHHGQDPTRYEGKILRFNLDPDGDAVESDRWIPNDNPYNTIEVQNAVWTLGHRNPQGLVFGPTGILYESEHGPYSDDEINIIERAHNYGHPLIVGLADGNYDGSAAAPGGAVPLIDSELENRAYLEIDYEYADPIKSLWPASQAEVSTIFTNEVNQTPPFDNYYLSWPTAAPSGIDYYSSNGIPGWNNSLLVSTLKLGRLYRLQLSADGKTFTQDTVSYFNGLGRIRDIAISPDGLKLYVITDSTGQLQGPAPGLAIDMPNKGCVFEFAYTATGVNEYLADAWTIFPNPVGSRLTVDLSLLPAAPLRVAVYDYLGRLVYETRMTEFPGAPLTIDASGWPEGQHHLVVQTEDQQLLAKKITVLRSQR